MIKLSNSTTLKVSILIAVYNRDFFRIKRALDSVLKQDFAGFEMVVIDDGCNLKLSEKLLKYAINNEERITYIRHKNRGQALSINQAIINSKGAFIGFIDSDDEYKTNHITECIKGLNDNLDLISSYTETIVTREEDYYVPDKHNIKANIHVDDCTVFGTLFGKREVFLNIGFNDMYSLDSDFFERASKVYRTKKLNLKTYIYYLGGKDSIITKTKINRGNQ